jgi:uncharacterized protein with LGFP repeats
MRGAAHAVVLIAASVALSVPTGGVARAATAQPEGADVASYQHPGGAGIDWAAYARSGRTFAVVKATEGTGYTNPYFAGDWTATTAAGLQHAAYHYARPALPLSTATDQAKYFVQRIGAGHARGELPPVLDLEVSGGLSTTDLVAWTKRWLSTVQRLTGVVPVVYSYQYFWITAMGDTHAFAAYPLWVASYGDSPPPSFGGWSGWTFWQYDDRGTAPGITSKGSLDLDRYNGSLSSLQALGGGAVYPIDARLMPTWTAAGGLAGWGAAISPPYRVGDGVGQDFVRGSVFTSSTVGTHALVGAIRAHYLAVGGPQVLGLPTSDETPGEVTGSRRSTFQRGRVYWSPTTGAHHVVGAILGEYLAAGPAALGLPTSDEVDAGVPGARVSAFQRGRVYWSGASGAHALVGGILYRYLVAGGPAALGLPTSDEADAGVPGGRVSVLQRGRIYWSATTGAHGVVGGILSHFLDVGGPAVLGLPVAAERSAGVAGGRVSSFQRGRVYWGAATGAHAVVGGILGRYLAAGGPASLGLPATDEQSGRVSRSRISTFENGQVWWSPRTGAHALLGPIAAEYANAGGAAVLGLPTGEETAVTGGRMATLQRGRIYWSNDTGAHTVVGGILSRYLTAGGPAVLGLPTADETGAGPAGTRVSVFQRGRVYWSADTGAHTVVGAILGHYLDMGGPARLGLPLTEEVGGGARGTRQTVFQRGRIYWSRGTGAHAVVGAILGRYLSLSGPAGKLGMPTTEEYAVTGGRAQTFAHGRITWSRGKGTTTVRYASAG